MKTGTSSLMDGTNSLNKIANEQNKFTISDELLFEQATVAMDKIYGSGCETEIDAYFRGAKWILKQFK
jgi:hypothetical protein